MSEEQKKTPAEVDVEALRKIAALSDFEVASSDEKADALCQAIVNQFIAISRSNGGVKKARKLFIETLSRNAAKRAIEAGKHDEAILFAALPVLFHNGHAPEIKPTIKTELGVMDGIW